MEKKKKKEGEEEEEAKFKLWIFGLYGNYEFCMGLCVFRPW